MNCSLPAIRPAAGANRTNDVMKIIIERIEDGIAVCELESGELVEAPLVLFGDVCEGDIVCLTVDERQTESKKEQAQSRLAALFARSEEDENGSD